MPARFLVCVAAGLLAASAGRAQPAGTAATDQIAVAVLKDVHDRGVPMYQADPAGCAKLYEGALRTVRAFLPHHPGIQADIDKGLDQDSGGDRARAFRLHEVIEKVRADLRAAAPKPAPKPEIAPAAKPEPKPAPEPAPAPRPAAPKPAAPAAVPGVGGGLTLDGQPLAGADVMLVSLDRPRPRVFTATADAAGKYAISGPVPDGTYAVTVTGGKVLVPDKFAGPGTSGLTVAVKGGRATLDLALKRK